MANLKGCFSHNSDDWSTPKKLYDRMISNGFFDPCPLNSNFDGLKIDWGKKVFINPPYSNISAFVDKAIDEFQKDYTKHIVFLVPSRTDTKWFKKLLKFATNIVFISGRLHFGNSKLGAPFPSMLVTLHYETIGSAICWCSDRSNYE